jgi:hypothetical protein
MPIDKRRLVIAALEAALDEARADPPKKRHGGAGGALLIGAGLFTAGRFALSGRGRGLLEAIQQRLPDEVQARDDDDHLDAESDEEFDHPDDPPEDEPDEDFDDPDDPPEDEPDEDSDDPDDPPDTAAGEDVDDTPADEKGEDVDDTRADEKDEDDEKETPRRRTRARATTRSRR